MVVYGMRSLTQRGQAYELLARAAAEYWGLEPLPEIKRTKAGKPYFPEVEGRTFNLSHSGELALCALDQKAVGVDIQVVKQWRPRLPCRVCSEQELAWLGSGDGFWPRFTLLWTLKESRVKCTGEGLRERISEIRVPLPTGNPGPCFLDGLWFCTYEGQGWKGAACGYTPPPKEISWLDWTQFNS